MKYLHLETYIDSQTNRDLQNQVYPTNSNGLWNNYLTKFICLILLFSSFHTYSKAGVNNIKVSDSAAFDTLCTPNPSKEAVALFRFLQDMYGKKILSGQMCNQWNGVDEIKLVYNETGKYPAIAGFDYITQSANSNENQRAINYWKSGGIPTIMWHWGAPGIGEGYENSKGTIDIDKCFIAGTKEYSAFLSELKIKADLLVKLRDAHVPVLWRPFHELDGGWFWWSKEGPTKFIQLWRTMYNYFVHERGLNNLVWVICYSGNLNNSWYPGDEYVDIVGADGYDTNTGSHLSVFNKITKVVGDNHIKCFHELGLPFDPDECFKDGAMWLWWMVWHTSYIQGIDPVYLKKVYNSELVLTRDELPDIDSVYGWNSTCLPSIITPYIQIDNSPLTQTNKIGRYYSNVVKLMPEAEGNGIWSWNGCGLIDSLREQTLIVNDFCTATATYLNECGATSTQTFSLYNDCTPTSIIPRLKVDEEEWQVNSNITIKQGSRIVLSPQGEEGGSWSWSGFDTLCTVQEITIIPTVSINPTVTYTNFCGKTSKFTYRVMVTQSSGIESELIGGNVSIYPLPCEESLNIEIKNLYPDSHSIVSILSAQGQLVFEKTVNIEKIEINTSSLKPKIYLIKIQNDRFHYTNKFLKIE
jgi:hypothetical protein